MAPKWECTKCLEDNSDSEEVCEFCDTARDDADPARLAQKAAEEREAGKEAARGDEPQPARERFTASPPTGGYAPFPPKPPRENLRFSGEDHRADAEADRAAAQWAQERRTRLLGELLIVDFCGGSERRTRLRALQLELHPDKHDRARQPYAQEMFLLVQSRWEEDEKGRKQRKQAEARRQEEQQAEEERQRQREAAREAAKAREAALRRQRDVEEAEQKRRLDAARAAAEREEARRRAEEEAEAQEASDQEGNQLDEEQEVTDFSFEELVEEQHRVDAARRRREREIRRELEERKASQEGEEEPVMDDEGPVQVNICDIQGPLRTISAAHTWLILDVKKQLERSEKVARQRQRLLCGDRDADDLEVVKELAAGAERLNLVLVVCMDKHFKLDLFVAAFRANWRTLQYASSALRANPKIVKMAVHQDWHALASASRDLQADNSLARLAVRRDGLALQMLAARMQNDRPLVLTAVQQNWRALQFASIRLRGDRDIVLEAVKQDPSALEFASQRLRGDRTVVLLAVRISGAALRFASPKLQADLEVVMEALQQDSKAIVHTAPEIRTDPKLHAAMRGNSEVLRFLGYDNRERKNTEQELFDMHMGIFKCPYDDDAIAAALRGERIR